MDTTTRRMRGETPQSIGLELPQAGRALAGLTFSDKTELPLAAADHFAYNAWGGVKNLSVLLGARLNPLNSYRGNAVWVDLNRDSLNSLHQQAIRIAHGGPSTLLPALEGTNLLNTGVQNPPECSEAPLFL